MPHGTTAQLDGQKAIDSKLPKQPIAWAKTSSQSQTGKAKRANKNPKDSLALWKDWCKIMANYHTGICPRKVENM